MSQTLFSADNVLANAVAEMAPVLTQADALLARGDALERGADGRRAQAYRLAVQYMEDRPDTFCKEDGTLKYGVGKAIAARSKISACVLSSAWRALLKDRDAFYACQSIRNYAALARGASADDETETDGDAAADGKGASNLTDAEKAHTALVNALKRARKAGIDASIVSAIVAIYYASSAPASVAQTPAETPAQTPPTVAAPAQAAPIAAPAQEPIKAAA